MTTTPIPMPTPIPTPMPTFNEIWRESISHCRWKTVLRTVLIKPELEIDRLHRFAANSFSEILLYIHTICNGIKGIGKLTRYDITAAICRYNNINIDKCYIIGKGPARAILILNIKTKNHKIKGLASLKYIENYEILQSFQVRNYEIDPNIKNSNNGDDFESYLCNWQKDK